MLLGVNFLAKIKANFCFVTTCLGNNFLALLVGWTDSSCGSNSTSLDGDRPIVSCWNGSSDYSSSCPDLHWEAFFFPKVRSNMLSCRYFLSLVLKCACWMEVEYCSEISFCLVWLVCVVFGLC